MLTEDEDNKLIERLKDEKIEWSTEMERHYYGLKYRTHNKNISYIVRHTSETKGLVFRKSIHTYELWIPVLDKKIYGDNVKELYELIEKRKEDTYKKLEAKAHKFVEGEIKKFIGD